MTAGPRSGRGPWFLSAAPGALIGVIVGSVAGCSPLPWEASLLRPEDCFGSVPYAFAGWTTLDAIGRDRGAGGEPADGRIYAMVTQGEVVLTVSPPAADGSASSVIGRGACWTWPGSQGISKASLGETRLVPNP